MNGNLKKTKKTSSFIEKISEQQYAIFILLDTTITAALLLLSSICSSSLIYWDLYLLQAISGIYALEEATILLLVMYNLLALTPRLAITERCLDGLKLPGWVIITLLPLCAFFSLILFFLPNRVGENQYRSNISNII